MRLSKRQRLSISLFFCSLPRSLGREIVDAKHGPDDDSSNAEKVSCLAGVVMSSPRLKRLFLRESARSGRTLNKGARCNG